MSKPNWDWRYGFISGLGVALVVEIVGVLIGVLIVM